MNTKRNNVRTIPQNLTVKALREMIADLPDEAEVLINFSEAGAVEADYSLIVTDGKPMRYTIPHCKLNSDVKKDVIYNPPIYEDIYTLELQVEPIY